VAARIGGEEFALLLPETHEAAAMLVAERLRRQVEMLPRVLGGEQVRVTVSIGVAGATLSMASFEALRKRADEALYEAKASGRNCVVRAPQEVSAVYQIAAE
jgi:diguanylate cyclase (GGDEF)-like protein